MVKMTSTVCIDAPSPAVWAVLASLESIHLWVPAILHSHCPAQSRGVGAMRVCELKQATIHETIVAWDEGRSFTYHGAGAPMMKHAANTWSIATHGDQTLVTSTAEVVFKGGVFGRLLELPMSAVFNRLGARSLVTLKYFVEHGHPFAGRARDLSPASATC